MRHAPQAYRHATGWGLPDVWGGCSREVAPFGVRAGAGAGSGPGEASAWRGAAANAPQPQLLGARRQLRRELTDLCFRCG